MTDLRPAVRSAIIKNAPSVKIHFQNRLKGVRVDEPAVVTTARVNMSSANVPVADPHTETVIEFALPAGTKLRSVRPEPTTESSAALDDERQQVERVVTHLRSACDKLLADRHTRLEQWQSAAIELAVTMASKLLHHELTTESFRYDDMIRDMAKQLGDDVPVTVRMHPDDVTILEKRLKGEPLFSHDRDPHLVPDGSLPRGEVRVDGKEAVLVSNVTRQLKAMRSDLLGRLGHARS